MHSALAMCSWLLLLGLAAGLSPAESNASEELSNALAAAAAQRPASAPGTGPVDSPELEAAAAALAGLLAMESAEDDNPASAPFGRQRRGGEGPATVDAGSPDWIMGLGVLSNMQQFFDNLRNNLESLESLPKEEREVLLGQSASASAEQERAFRPRATAAYLHALRNHRPSHKIRNFVAEPEPASLRGSNHYDPNWLWTGLGRRR